MVGDLYAGCWEAGATELVLLDRLLHCVPVFDAAPKAENLKGLVMRKADFLSA